MSEGEPESSLSRPLEAGLARGQNPTEADQIPRVAVDLGRVAFGWQEGKPWLQSVPNLKANPSRRPRLRPRMRVLCGGDIALGPGKVDLLALVGQTGSIREAAERMGMSYMRAWKLIKTMNACFKEPLVKAERR